MFDDFRSLSSSQTGQDKLKATQIAEFWARLRTCDELDAAMWEVLEPIECQVTECLDRRRLAEAESLTAQVMILLACKKTP